MPTDDEKTEAAVEYYYIEVANLLLKANEPLRIALMLLAFATKLGDVVPDEVRLYLENNKQLIDRMSFMCLPVDVEAHGPLN